VVTWLAFENDFFDCVSISGQLTDDSRI
jgi:hypothetical protein